MPTSVSHHHCSNVQRTLYTTHSPHLVVLLSLFYFKSCSFRTNQIDLRVRRVSHINGSCGFQTIPMDWDWIRSENYGLHNFIDRRCIYACFYACKCLFCQPRNPLKFYTLCLFIPIDLTLQLYAYTSTSTYRPNSEPQRERVLEFLLCLILNWMIYRFSSIC